MNNISVKHLSSMRANVISFGKIPDIMGRNAVLLPDVHDTDQVVTILHERYPALANIPYRLAVNHKIIEGNTALTEDAEIALLPPFSGG